MSEHTRGPWKLMTEHPRYSSGKPSEIVIYSDEGEVLRTLSLPANIWDFYLIASAPELLEVCKEALDYFDQRGFMGAPMERLKDRLREAAAKAEGHDAPR